MFLSEAHLSLGEFARAAKTLQAARALAVKHDEQPSAAYIDFQFVRTRVLREGALAASDHALLNVTAARAESMQMFSLARRCRRLLCA